MDMKPFQCPDCGKFKKATHENEVDWYPSFFAYGCDCDDPDSYGYGPTQELAYANYWRKRRAQAARNVLIIGIDLVWVALVAWAVYTWTK